MSFRVLPFVLLAIACSSPHPEAAVDAATADVGSGSDPLGEPTDTCTVDAGDGKLVIATERGLVRGATAGHVTQFLGIPFGAPPVGALRFQPPSVPACWSGVHDATAYAAECPQRDVTTGAVVGSEDCLYLNVWTPTAALSDGRPRPVLYWIYGGANVLGSTNTTGLSGGNEYSGQALADARDVVVVSVSYRVGPLGFLAHPALTAESPRHSSGSYGILDQIVGLKWVHRNIAHFGGDPAHVMAFGESAGAINTCTLLASPLAAGLFSSALMESGFCVGVPLAEAETYGTAEATSIGCGSGDVAACLRAASLQDLTVAFTSTPTIPAGKTALDELRLIPAGLVDGWVLAEHPLTALAGAHNHVPLIVGSNAAENALFLLGTTVLTCSDYESQIRANFGPVATQVLALYPCNALDPKGSLVQAETDSFFTCAARRTLRAAASGQTEPTRRYYFTFTSLANAALGAYHTAEIPYVFGTYKSALSLPSPSEDAISATIQAYWSTLAATGDPDGNAMPAWSPYVGGQDDALDLGSSVSMIDGVKSAQCDFWDTVTPP